jgi:hypothetical protein
VLDVLFVFFLTAKKFQTALENGPGKSVSIENLGKKREQ